MSWAEVTSRASCTLRPSQHESARFGVTVERALVGDSSSDDIDKVSALVAGSTADVVILRYSGRHVSWFSRLVAGERVPVLADTLVYWSLRTGAGARPDPSPELSWDQAGTEDAADAARLVGEIFDGYGNHYLANPLFDPAAALAGYQEWATRTVAQSPAVFLRLDGEAIAVATIDQQPDWLEIELAGVVAREQGRGRYASLLAGVEDVAVRLGLQSVVISTQGHNVNVQRAWARYGFEPVASFLTVHLVRAGLLPAAR